MPSIGESQQRNSDSIIDQYDLPTDGITKIVTKTVQPIKPTVETEQDTEFRIPPVPGRLINKPNVRVETADPKTPTTTKLNPCKKGCGGSSGGLTQSSANGLQTSAQLADSALLTVINNKLGGQIANGGISGAMGKLHKSLAFDRWLNLLNTALLFHNAFMLGSSVVDTVVLVFENVLDTIGFKFSDVDGSEISFGTVISKGIRTSIQSIIGQQTYNQITHVMTKGNRFLNASANLLYNFRSIFDSGQDIVETIGENVSFIGNALKKDGVVRENSYKWMPGRFDHSSRLINRLEKLGDGADVLEEITEDAKDLSEEVQELRANKKEYDDELEKVFKDKLNEENKQKKIAINTPEPLEKDEDRALEDGE